MTKTAPVPEAPSDSDTFVITPAEASKLGLHQMGFQLRGLKGHGWTRFGPDRKQYLGLSGPPGGPLSFKVTPYSDGVSDPPTLEKLFEDMVKDNKGLEPIVRGKPETVALAGKDREAQAFRTGQSHATSVWCVVKVPAEKIGRVGLLVTLRVGTREKGAPQCAQATKHTALAKLISSFQLE